MLPNFEQPVKPLTAGLGDVETVQTVFFYQRPDGSIIHAAEREAWQIHTSLKGWAKQYGVSDGVIFQKAVQESRDIFKTQGLEKAQERVRKGIAEEQEAAKGHYQVPRNHTWTDREGQPVDGDGQVLRLNPRS